MSHFTKLTPLKIITPLLLTMTLTACGGGGDSESRSTDTPVTPITPSTPTSTDEEQFGLWLTDLADNVILPAYQDLLNKATILSSQSADFCALNSPSNSDLQTLQQNWSDFNGSWQNIQWLKVGPVIEESRIFRLELWPDDNDSVTSAITSILAEPEITADLFETKYVGGQGIPALEVFLFSTDQQTSLLSANDKDKRCEALTAIGENLVNITTDINRGWQTTGDNYVASLKAGTGDFTSKKDAVEELVTNWLEQVEQVKDEKLLKSLADAAPGLPDTAEFTLANEVIASVKINAMAFSQLYSAGNGHGFDDILTDHFEQLSISADITNKIDSIIGAINLLDETMSYPELLNDTTSREQLTDVIQKIRELRDLITADFVQATDINIGFNSNDGD
jgi:predicted lipoprotein